MNVGNKETTSPTPAMDVGGQAVVAAGGTGTSVPAPTPPVCQAESVAGAAAPVSPREAQKPTASRGSSGM